MPYSMIKDLTMLTNDIVNFEQIDPGYGVARKLSYRILSNYHTYPYKCTVKRLYSSDYRLCNVTFCLLYKGIC